MWEGSPFQWIKNCPSRSVGAIGEKLVENWCREQVFEVRKSLNSAHDRLNAGLKVEIKFSTLWSNNPIFRFQQI